MSQATISRRQELLQLLSSAERLAAELQEDIFADAVYRASVTKLSKSLLGTVQTPPERAWEIFLQADTCSLLRVAFDAGWLDSVAKAPSTGISAKALASQKGHDVSIISRIMRCLVASGTVDEVGINEYAPNSLTNILVFPGMRDGLIHMSENNSRTVVHLPQYFKNNNYQTPIDIVQGPFVYACGMTLWDVNQDRPAIGRAFDNFMNTVKGNKKDWYHALPAEAIREIGGSTGNDILMVDIGGGLGEDLIGFDQHRRQLGIPGRLVLQDQPQVLEKVQPDWKKQFEAVPQDFFTPQPQACLHARVYYMRMIIHDWADAAALTILGHVRDAMKPGFSTFLVNDIVMPDRDCPFFETYFDLAMLTMLSGKERTRLEWEDLVSKVDGLKIKKIWPLEEGANCESLIEIVRTK